jgi:hypothetical protein
MVGKKEKNKLSGNAKLFSEAVKCSSELSEAMFPRLVGSQVRT